MPRKETSCSRIKQTWHIIDKMYNNEAIEHDLTTTIGFVLLNIDPIEGTPSTSIAPMLGMEPTSLSRTLFAMEKKKLIIRKKDPDDGRKVRILLTKKGLKKRDISKNTVKDFNTDISDLIAPKRLEIFNEVLQQIAQLASEKKFTNNG
ncbi:MAG: MarR family winged helix-turn-helix transcriptional regulator [Bacteroidota bacterium]|nr:MarR family winged helix-turn-helix transcriptional regulator [Bacteroidota bacterium]